MIGKNFRTLIFSVKSGPRKDYFKKAFTERRDPRSRPVEMQ